MTLRLISPLRRRIADTRTFTVETITQLKNLGWLPYEGPGDATTGLTRTTAGWIIPGTRPCSGQGTVRAHRDTFAVQRTDTRMMLADEPVPVAWDNMGAALYSWQVGDDWD